VKTVKWLVLIFVLSITSNVYAQESSTAAEFRREGEKFKENCSRFELKLITGCGEQLFTGKPLHIAVGSIAPQNGLSFGPAFVKHWTPSENWKWNLNSDGVVSTNGSLSEFAMADTAFRIFDQSRNNEVRQLCLETLYQANTTAARKKLQLIAQDTSVAQVWRTRSASYLGGSVLKPGELRPLEAGISLWASGND